MPRKLLIAFDATRAHDLRSQIWHFGEDLHRTLEKSGFATVSLDDVDAVRDRLVVTVRSKQHVRRTIALIGEVLDRHFSGASRWSANSKISLLPTASATGVCASWMSSAP